ncbi:SMP-30/gluconolactonase/LRE family protein [Chitinophaga oryzae]|uniref:SMP-30/gluconolactonase/LRE family protein n=1 Tax=Chitinophaga oryzae TaxID=2725414 RepID=A0ABX6LIW3_9BACT|nr:SMP-30/gluconolactonase/LRE family protein [Chitinophaga oryzae]QJB39708.1 SMP-30/gluconolactonase/LRE family protein [Chitinophaga oryzae]
MEIYQSALFSTGPFELGEGAFWWPERSAWCWVDILGHSLYMMDSKGQRTQYHIGEYVTMMVPVQGSNELLLGLHGRVARFSPEHGLGRTLAVLDGNPGLRCNDGKCDPAGRLWVGTMHLTTQRDNGALYCIDHNRPPVIKIPQVSISNGIVWYGDRMYFNDTVTNRVQEYAYEVNSGEIKFLRNAVVIPAELGSPDGMTIDSEGMLWVAHWGGGGVYRWNPANGKLLGKLEVPALQVSCCVFGGPDMQEMLITTAREHMTPQQLEAYPMSGNVFHAKLPFKGLPVNYFKY